MNDVRRGRMPVLDMLENRWLRLVSLVWLITCGVMVWHRWGMIKWFSLPDTDDNMRMSQVRALLNGQGWYDLRQYKMNPPDGFNMHWSRLVDLPIAGLDMLARMFVSGQAAERFAAAVAPMLPLWIALFALALTARRLIAPTAGILAALFAVICCQASLSMFMPMRIDHHNWQLAFLVLGIAGVADPGARRGGIVLGLASAASLVIGLELLPFLMIMGAATVLRWVWQPDDAPRVSAYGLSLAVGCAAGYLGFASYDNAVPRCDVLSPVWLGAMVAAGWIAWLLPQSKSTDWRIRLGLAAVAGGVLVAGFALLAPQCLGRPEQVSPALYDSWLKNISEFKPLYTKDWQVAVATIALPLAGVIGAFVATWRARGTALFAVWAPIALISLTSMLLLLWQTRMGAAAQLTAVPGATALTWLAVPALRRSTSVLTRTIGVVVAFLLFSGLGVQLVLGQIPGTKPTARSKAIDRANGRCPTLPALAPIAKLPATTIFTFVDMGPRLITVTHHKAIAGPYHRNGDAILDVHRAFDGTPENAYATIKRHRATLLMTCPNMSESTVYRTRSPKGFYSQLATGKRFDWLEPVPLPRSSPLLLWRVK
ncbi:MAG: AcrB/AcrD/AcrF family protein [Pseudomonadota bacterium]